jgi:hypothetical protein
MAKKDNNGYIGNPTLGLDNQGIISRNKNFDTRFYTQYDVYSNDTNLMSSPPYIDTRQLLTQSITTGGGSGSLATASLSNGSIANMVLYNGGSGYGVNTLITMSFSNGGGVDAAAYVSAVGAGIITGVAPLYSIQDVYIADGGGPYTSPPTLSFSLPPVNNISWRPQVTAVASASITNGKVTSITIYTSGSNYVPTSFPTITVTGGGLPSTGTHAVLVPVLRNGRGYTSNPTLTITSPSGTGAIISSSFIAGINSINVTNSGGGYSSPPTVQIQGASLQNTSASAVLSGNTVSTVSVVSGSSRFATAPSINVSGGLPPFPGISNNQIAAWYGVYNNNSNFIGLQISTNGGGGYTVNWGDGTSTNYNSNALAYKQYTTSSYTTLTSSLYSVTDLFKPALITVTLSGSATSFNVVDFTTLPSPPTGSLINNSPNNLRSIKMAGDQVTRLVVGAYNSNRLSPTQLERFEYSGSNKITDFSSIFSGCYNLVEVTSLYTTSGSNMTSAFTSCYNLQKIPSLDFTNVTNASNTFTGCSKLREITLLNSQQVTTWTGTFQSCYNLQSINATFSSASTNYSTTFSACNNLTSTPTLNISNNTTFSSTFNNCFNLKRVKFIGTTSKVTTFAQAFNNCYSLESIPLTIDFSVCTNSSFMLNNCQVLKVAPILTNTRTLTNISAMFQGCKRLVNIPWFDTINVTTADALFSGCSTLTSVPLFNFARNTTFANMFTGCNNLITIPPFETSNSTNFSSMFGNAISLKEVPFFNTSKGTNFASMFSGCQSLLKVPTYDLQEATSTSFMFASCQALQEVPFFNLSKCLTPSSMFNGCSSLIYVSYLNVSLATDVSSMFANCNALKYIGTLDTSKATNFSNMFISCNSLTSIPLIDTSRGTTFTGMFQSCGLVEIPALNMSASTTISNFAVGSSISGFKRISATGMNATLDVSGNNLDSTALNEIYTNLSATGATKSISVSNNWGTANDNPSIATAKGWAVTG